jgi:hypothetical protein
MESSRVNPKIRVKTNGMTGRHGQVFYVDENGVETELSGCVQRVDLSIDVNEINSATIRMVMVDSETEAFVDEVLVNVLPPTREGYDKLIEKLTQKRDSL